VLSYRGLTEQQVDELLQREAGPVMASRHAAAQELLQAADRFLQHQAAEWVLAADVIGSWLSSLVSLYAGYKARTGQAEVAFKAGLRAAQEQFAGEDAAREAALKTATLLLSQGSDEQELDARLEAALQALDTIAGGYRSYAAAATATARAYPGQVAGSCDLAFKCLCGLLHVQPQLQPAGEAYASQGCSIQVPRGGAFDLPHDLWGALLCATPKPWLEEARRQQQQHQQQRAMSHGREGSEAPAAAVPAAAANPVAAGVKMTKQQLAEVAAAEEAAQAAAAAAAAAEAEAAALAAAAVSPPCPADSHGGALCLCLPLPDAVVQEGLQQMQVTCWRVGWACPTAGRAC
jgi:hypothetical protein